MLKSLLRLLAFSLIPLILMIVFVGPYNPLTIILKTIEEQHQLKLFDTTFKAVERDLLSFPVSEQDTKFNQIAQKFQTKFEINALKDAGLSRLELMRINKGNTIMLYRGEGILARKLGDRDFIIVMYILETEDEETFRLAIGPITMITDELYQHPQEQWSSEVAKLAEDMSFNLELVGQDSFVAPDNLTGSFTKKNISWYKYGDAQEIFVIRLEGSDQYLVVGPIVGGGQIGLAIFIYLSFISVIVIVSSAGLMLWLWPLWKSLNAVKTSAQAFGKGDLRSRVVIKKSSIVSDLGDSFNGMADSIQKLIDTNQQLTNAVAHDLRTPLARLRFAIEILESGDCSAEEASLYKQSVESSINSLDYLINQTLIHSRYNRVADIRNFANSAFANVIREEVEQFEFDHADFSFEISIDNALEGNQQFIDVNALRRALNNLLSNAVKYGSSRIKVSYYADRSLHLIVEDDGEGISPEDYDRVKKPFVQVENEERDSSLGHGLGLAIVNQIAKWHKGHVIINKSGFGGASIEIVWPKYEGINS